jgi:hypothetical protein
MKIAAIALNRSGIGRTCEIRSEKDLARICADERGSEETESLW